MDLSLTQLTFRDFVPESLRNDYLEGKCKEIGKIFSTVECVFLMVATMVAVPMLPHAEFERNDHWEYAFHFIFFENWEFLFRNKIKQGHSLC